MGLLLQTHTVLVNGFPIHYAQCGNDTMPTIVFIHGSPGSWNAFERYMQDKELLSRFRLIAIDRPGFGYSRFGDARNLKQQSLLLSPVIHLLQNGKVLYAVGHSLGGPVAVQLQADNNNLFSGLILLAASVDPKEEKPERWRPFLFKSPLNYFVPGAFKASNEELWYLKKDLYKLDSLWYKLTCPVWIVHGSKDGFVPPGNAVYAQKKLSHASSVIVTMIPNARHFIPWEQYNEVKRLLLHLPV